MTRRPVHVRLLVRVGHAGAHPLAPHLHSPPESLVHDTLTAAPRTKASCGHVDSMARKGKRPQIVRYEGDFARSDRYRTC
jgi:hypothetical protein